MSTDLSARDAQALATSLRAALDNLSPSSRVRELMATDAGWNRDEWRRLCREIGLAGIAVEEIYGGSGMSAREAGLVFEEAGRAMVCAPLFAVAALAIPMLASVGDRAAMARWLPELVSGDLVATVALADRLGRTGVEHLAITAVGDRLTGRSGFVVDGAHADLILVPAHTAEGVGVFVVAADTPGLTVTPLITLDQTRKQAHLDFADTPAVRIGEGDASGSVSHATDVARAMLACELVGVMAQSLAMTVDFAKMRVQFGRPIGSFQAVKQKLAALLITSESARSAATAAADTASQGSHDLPWTAAVAKAYCSESASLITAEAIQLHGGIGFTWEHDAHLYFKRARASEEMLGTSRENYDVVADHLSNVVNGVEPGEL